jgi:hypothetical protein
MTSQPAAFSAVRWDRDPAWPRSGIKYKASRFLRAGNVFVVSRIARLARSLKDLQDIRERQVLITIFD